MKIKLFTFLVLCLFLSACADYTPKPMGYFRIAIPENEYHIFDSAAYPYSFELSKYAEIIPQRDVKSGDKYWLNIYYPQFKGTIYCSYKHIEGNLQELSEDSREFVYKHSIKADNISEQPYFNPAADKYGTLYRIEGNTASSMQFVLTDSTDYFFRGALYFDAVPNKDSIAPVLDFVSEDILVLMETFKHKK
jgi:gliding motility-associated lipoprotein GldD